MGPTFFEIYKIVAWLGMVPFQYSQRETKIKSFFQKMYIVVIGSLGLILHIQDAFFLVTFFFQKLGATSKIIIPLQWFFKILFFASIILGSIHFDKLWTKLFCQTKHLERQLNASNKKLTFLQYIYIYGVEIIYILYMVYIYCLSKRSLDTPNLIRTVHEDMSIFYQISMTSFINCFFQMVVEYYCKICEMLVRNQFQGRFSKERVHYTKLQIHHVRDLFLETSRLVERFNKILNWPVLLIVLNTFFGVITVMDIVSLQITSGDYSERLMLHFQRTVILTVSLGYFS